MSYCIGCRARNKQCAFLKKGCDLLIKNKIEFCYECENFPCEKLSRLDKRYRADFKMSWIDNLRYIQERRKERFLRKQKRVWKCSRCNGLICCHNGLCFDCDIEKLRMKKNRYRWED
jgi:hypothetical protein